MIQLDELNFLRLQNAQYAFEMTMTRLQIQADAADKARITIFEKTCSPLLPEGTVLQDYEINMEQKALVPLPKAQPDPIVPVECTPVEDVPMVNDIFKHLDVAN